MKTTLFRTLPILSVCLALPASAVTIIESFDYQAGSNIGGQNGGSGWDGPWTAQAGNATITTEAGTLSAPGVAGSGGKLQYTGVAATGTSSNSFRVLATAQTEGMTYYYSYLGQNLNEGRRFFGLALFDGTGERTLLGQGSTYGNWTLNRIAAFSSTNAVMDSGVDSSTLAHLVLKVELLAGVERLTMWINPDLSQPENVATAVGGQAHLTDVDFNQITRVRIGGGGFSASAGGDPTNHFMDELRISSDSPFAVPEPSTALLLVAAGWRRRRR